MADNATDQKERSTGHTLDGRPVADVLPEGWGQPLPSKIGRVQDGGGGGRASRSRRPPATSHRGVLQAVVEGEDNMDSDVGGESGPAAESPTGAARETTPDRVIKDILRKAAMPSMSAEETPVQPPVEHAAWTTPGHTLGSDDTPSVSVNSPNDTRQPLVEVQQRTLTFWRDGFSIEDGPLYRYDDPRNSDLLVSINAGRAPRSVFNAASGQPLEVVVHKRSRENYVSPPRVQRAVEVVQKGFAGPGNRLGNEMPVGTGVHTPLNPVTASPPQAIQDALVQSNSEEPGVVHIVSLDHAKPSTKVQIRMADGSRRVLRVNLDQTVGDIRRHIDSLQRGIPRYVLQTTFPSRGLADEETIEAAKLANSVVVQRYT